jgi:hypothetical protein
VYLDPVVWLNRPPRSVTAQRSSCRKKAGERREEGLRAGARGGSGAISIIDNRHDVPVTEVMHRFNEHPGRVLGHPTVSPRELGPDRVPNLARGAPQFLGLFAAAESTRCPDLCPAALGLSTAAAVALKRRLQLTGCRRRSVFLLGIVTAAPKAAVPKSDVLAKTGLHRFAVNVIALVAQTSTNWPTRQQVTVDGISSTSRREIPQRAQMARSARYATA